MEAYLQRIQARPNISGTLSDLTHLQMQHVQNVPFENMDIMDRQPLSLDTSQLYEKMVNRNQGGICFELNAAFHYLLQAFGFNARIVGGTTYIGGAWFELEDCHMGILVDVENRTYLVDVGFGGKTPRKPVPLTGEEVETVEGWYRVTQEGETGYLQHRADQTWNTMYCFSFEEKPLSYFVPKCEWMETAAGSPFNGSLFVTMAVENGRKTLSGRSLTVVEGRDGKSKSRVVENQVSDTLKDEFGLQRS